MMSATTLPSTRALAAARPCQVRTVRARAAGPASAPKAGPAKKAAPLVGAAAAWAAAAAPALALVDDRMNGDGVGLPLGINDPALAIALASVATFVWSQYYLSQRDLGGDKGDDSGLSLYARLARRCAAGARHGGSPPLGVTDGTGGIHIPRHGCGVLCEARTPWRGWEGRARCDNTDGVLTEKKK